MSAAAHQERLMTVIRGPHVSEKSHLAAENNQVVLKVRVDATKREIRQAVEMLFEVEVDDVTVVNVKGKNKRFGQTRGRRKDWKKAPRAATSRRCWARNKVNDHVTAQGKTDIRGSPIRRRRQDRRSAQGRPVRSIAGQEDLERWPQ